MTDQLAAIAAQRGKVVFAFVVAGFVQGMAHPETAGSVYMALGVAVAALAGMEAFASKGSA